MKTILVTGATGFVGGNLVKRLSGEGYRLIVLVRSKGRWDRFLNEVCGERVASASGGLPTSESTGDRHHLEGVELIKGDITLPLLGLSSRRFRRLAWQVDTIFHCAALTDFTDQNQLFRTNVEGTRHLLQFALLGRKKYFHHISSAYIAGKSSGTFYEADFNKNQGFNNSYEESKFNSEALVMRFAREHLLPFTVYRPSIIVGDSETGHTRCYKGFYAFARALSIIKERVFKRRGRYPGESSFFQRVASTEIPMRIFGDPGALINLVPVDYVVEAISEISKRPEAQGKTFHLTNPHSITLAQLTDKVSQVLGIEGVSPCPEPERSRANPTERFFLYYTRPYLPYLRSHLSFDTSNTVNMLNGTVTCPNMTHRLITTLIDRAIEDGWGEGNNGRYLCAEAVGDSVQN